MSRPQKFSDEEVLSAFDERHRRAVGKWELSSAEVAEWITEGVKDGRKISRQAVHKRLERIDDVVKVKHGRTVTWRLAKDTLTTQHHARGRPGDDMNGESPAVPRDNVNGWWNCPKCGAPVWVCHGPRLPTKQECSVCGWSLNFGAVGATQRSDDSAATPDVEPEVELHPPEEPL